ncbi:MAG: hypothetical protein JNL58_04515 [Planctomyces sp.]|nr:hypothetical protein [Planctomyces sp.]
MTPILFIADIETSSLVDPTAIGDETNPFQKRLSTWESLGLLDYISDVNTGRWCGWQEVKGSGPDGQSGFAFRVLPKQSREDAAPILTPSTVWHRASERVWFSGTIPTPDELLRYSLPPLPTHSVLLSDGQVWEVPRIRRPIAGGYVLHPTQNLSELPQRVRKTWDGQVILEPSPAWNELWQKSLRFAMSIWGESQGITYQELYEFALELLGMRYRYTDLIARAFPEPLEIDSLWRVIRAACGGDLVEAELQKKRQYEEADVYSQ